jgi:hypothetical protein
MLMDKEKQIFPRIEIVPIRRIGRAILGFFQMHQLSEVSDHKFDHPFDHELYDMPICIPEDAPVQKRL